MHAFDVLGDPIRRRILELLAQGETIVIRDNSADCSWTSEILRCEALLVGIFGQHVVGVELHGVGQAVLRRDYLLEVAAPLQVSEIVAF